MEKEHSNSSINDRLKMNLNRIENAIKEKENLGSLNKSGLKDLAYDDHLFNNFEQLRGNDGFAEEMGGGYDFPNEGRYASSMKKMIDDADRLIQGRDFPDQYFLQENLKIINQDLLGRLEGVEEINEDFQITPGKIREIEQNYLTDTVDKTKRKKSGKFLEERIGDVIQNFEDLEKLKITYEGILDRILGKDGKEIIEGITEQNEEFRELCEVIQGSKVDPNIQNNIQELNNLYKQAVEVGRLDIERSTEQRPNPNLQSHSREKPSERPFSSDQQFGDNYQLDNQNLDIIIESMNENFSKTNYLNSYQIWNRLNDQGQLKRRREWRGSP